MSKFFIVAIISLFLTGLSAGQDKDIRKEVEAIYEKRQKAILDKSFARLKLDWADDYTAKNKDGMISNRQQAEAEIDELSLIIKDVFEYSLKVVSVKGDKKNRIIVETVDSGEVNYVGPYSKPQRLSRKGRQRDIWIRTHGELKLKYHEDLESNVQEVISDDATFGKNEFDREWKYIGSYADDGDNEVKVFYEPQSITRTSDGLVQMWIKQIAIYENEETKKRSHAELIENRRLNKFLLKGYEKYAYSTTLLEIDCARRLERLPCIKDYDESGKVIGEQCIKGLPFQPVPKQTIEGLPFEPVAKQRVVLETLNAACDYK
jgi:hypothetical protein